MFHERPSDRQKRHGQFRLQGNRRRLLVGAVLFLAVGAASCELDGMGALGDAQFVYYCGAGLTEVQFPGYTDHGCSDEDWASTDRSVAVGARFLLVFSQYYEDYPDWVLRCDPTGLCQSASPASSVVVADSVLMYEGPFTMLALNEDDLVDFIQLNGVRPTALVAEVSYEDGETSHRSADLQPGQIVALRAYPLGSGGRLAGTFDYTWTSMNPSIATINEQGHLEAVSPGETVVQVTNGELDDELTVHVE